jgi:hypothetical protein
MRPTWSLCSDTEAPRLRKGRSKALDLDHRALAAQILAVQPFVEKTTAAPLVVKGEVFVGISGGGPPARAEQSEPLSGSANARLCLAGRLSQ